MAFPEGHVERAESLERCAERELREEAGVLGSLIGPVLVAAITPTDCWEEEIAIAAATVVAVCVITLAVMNYAIALRERKKGMLQLRAWDRAKARAMQRKMDWN